MTKMKNLMSGRKRMTQSETKLIDECIESHRRMIAYHRRQIVELSRKKIKEPQLCKECFGMEIVKFK